MDTHHVLNDPLAGSGMNSRGDGQGQGQSYGRHQMGQQPQQQQQHHQQQYNDFTVDPSLIGDSWQQQQPAQSYSHPGHQDVFSPPPPHQQAAYSQYGQSPQPPHFSYGQPHQQAAPQQQQPAYSAQYAGLYGQQSQSPATQNAVHYDNQFNGMPNNAHSIMNGDQVPSRGFQSFDRAAVPFPYPSASRGPTPQQTIAPHDLNRDAQYLGQTRGSSMPQQQSNGDVNNLFGQSWGSQSEYNAAAPASERLQSRQVLAPTPDPTNQVAPPSRLATASTTSQPASKPPSPAPSQQSFTSRKKKDEAGLRVTHGELLEKADPQRRFENAPFLFIDSRTVELSDKLAHKALPSWQVKSNRSGRPLVEGLHERLSAIGRPHKGLSSKTKYQAGGANKIERVRTTSATGSATNSPRPSVDSETESSQYSSSEEDSDYSSDDDEIMDLRTLEEVRPEPRPTDTAEAAAWDAFTIMYSPAGRRPHPEERKTVGQKFPDLISKLREQLIKANTDLAAAEAKKAPTLKALKVEQRSREQALVKALRVAIDSPHQDLRDTLFSFDKFVVIISNTLRMVVKSEDYFGDLAMAVLELMSTYKFKGPGKEALEKAKFSAIAKRLKSRADNEAADESTKKRQQDVKRFIHAIEESQVETKPEARRVGAFTAISKAAKPDENAAPRSDTNPSRASATATTRYEGTSGLKRPRESDNSANIPNKRSTPTSEATKPVSKQLGTITPGPQKPASSFFSKLGKQTPKPATPPTAGSATAKPVVKKPAPAQSQRPSVLGSLLDSINAPKEEPKKVEAIERAPETPEEKKKRERKESRRHLRVKFKDGGELEEIRLFTHEKAEDEGRDVDMLRDAHDDRSEGMMLKQRIDTDLVDEDEDTNMADTAVTDINFKDYPQLKDFDFSLLDDEVRERNVVHRGGYVKVRTPQQEVQEKREATELMVVYTDEADIPESAKEPSIVPVESTTPSRFGDITNQEIKDRLRDIQFSGDDAAYANLVSALEARIQKKAELEAQKARLTSGPEALEAILNAIKVNPTIDVSDFYVPAGMAGDDMANLYRVFAAKKGLTYPATQAPDWMPDAMKRSWYEGVAKEEARKLNIEAEKNRLVAEEEGKRAFEARQQAAFQPQMGAAPMGVPSMGQPPAPFMGAPPLGGHYPGMPSLPVDPSQMAAMMASLGIPNATQTPVMPPWGGPPPAGFSPQTQAYGNENPNPYPGTYNQNNDQQGAWSNDAYGNNRRNNNYGDESSDNNKKKRWGKKGKGGQSEGQQQYHGERQNDRTPGYKRKTVECEFFKKGKCMKGDDCTYIHDRN